MKSRMIIVDDEVDMLDFIERVFRSDYQVVRAASAEEALHLLTTARFHVIITDQKMPHITGIELLERIGDSYPDLVKVLLSGFTDLPQIEYAVDRCGIHNYVVKPADSDKLRSAVIEAVERHARGRALSDSSTRRLKLDS